MAVAVYKTKAFQRFARKAKIADAALFEAVKNAELGKIYADLGRDLIKQQISRPGQSKSKGFRVFIAFRRGFRAAFVYGFAKSDRDNIDDDEKLLLQDAGEILLGLSKKDLELAVDAGELIAVEGKEETDDEAL